MSQKQIEELKFSDLRVRYGTGRSIHVSGTGRDKKFRYRHGVMTDLGDLEISEWNSLINALIKYHSEREIQQQLRQWCKAECLWLHSDDEVEEYALSLHAARICNRSEDTDQMPADGFYGGQRFFGSTAYRTVRHGCRLYQGNGGADGSEALWLSGRRAYHGI